MGRIAERDNVTTVLKWTAQLVVLLGSAGDWAQGAEPWVIGPFTRPATGIR